MTNTDSDAGDETEDTPPWLRIGAIAGGVGLVGSYVLPWVAVTGETVSGVNGSISGRELELVPEVTVVLGVVAVALAALRWQTWTRLLVLGAGLAATGVGLFGWFFLDSDADLIRLGGRAGPPGSFDPGLGLTLALVASLVLVAVGFVGALQALPDR